jgi:hypothetical protein
MVETNIITTRAKAKLPCAILMPTSSLTDAQAPVLGISSIPNQRIALWWLDRVNSPLTTAKGKVKSA